MAKLEKKIFFFVVLCFPKKKYMIGCPINILVLNTLIEFVNAVIVPISFMLSFILLAVSCHLFLVLIKLIHISYNNLLLILQYNQRYSYRFPLPLESGSFGFGVLSVCLYFVFVFDHSNVVPLVFCN